MGGRYYCYIRVSAFNPPLIYNAIVLMGGEAGRGGGKVGGGGEEGGGEKGGGGERGGGGEKCTEYST